MTLLVFYKKRAVSVRPGPPQGILEPPRSRVSYELKPTLKKVSPFVLPWLGARTDLVLLSQVKRPDPKVVRNSRAIIESRVSIGATEVTRNVLVYSSICNCELIKKSHGSSRSQDVMSAPVLTLVSSRTKATSYKTEFSHLTAEEILLLFAA
jgi:hypothetical protein